MVNREVLVIGASSGLGAALAILHRRAGDNVTAVARRAHRLQQLAQLSQSPGAGQWVSDPLNLLDLRAVDELASRHSPKLVYLAAATGDSTDPSALMALNFHRMVELADRFAREGTTIVAISSLAAVVAFPGLAWYCASKSALEQWIACNRTSYRSRLVVIRPGRFTSEFFGRRSQLSLNDLPWRTAAQVIASVKNRRAITTLGGWRDILAANLAPLLGSPIIRRLVLDA